MVFAFFQLTTSRPIVALKLRHGAKEKKLETGAGDDKLTPHRSP
mgnify:FL=1